MICVTEQIKSPEWEITQTELTASIVIPVKMTEDAASFPSICVPCPETWLGFCFVFAVSHETEQKAIFSAAASAHANYLLNEAKAEFYQLCLTVSHSVWKGICNAGRKSFSRLHNFIYRPRMNFCFTGVMRL